MPLRFKHRIINIIPNYTEFFLLLLIILSFGMLFETKKPAKSQPTARQRSGIQKFKTLKQKE
jgi:hypothetical protein